MQDDRRGTQQILQQTRDLILDGGFLLALSNLRPDSPSAAFQLLWMLTYIRYAYVAGLGRRSGKRRNAKEE